MSVYLIWFSIRIWLLIYIYTGMYWCVAHNVKENFLKGAKKCITSMIQVEKHVSIRQCYINCERELTLDEIKYKMYCILPNQLYFISIHDINISIYGILDNT